MIAQAAGLALLAALSPTALLVAAVYLGSARPRLTSLFYLAGAVAMSLVMGVVILVALRSSGLNHPDQHAPRYGSLFPHRTIEANIAPAATMIISRCQPSHLGETRNRQLCCWPTAVIAAIRESA